MRSLAMLAILALAAGAAAAQVSGPPVNVTTTPAGKSLAKLPRAADQLALLKSNDPKLARNKKHVFDFWRIVYEAGHMERAAEFMAPEYIQHNPNVESGRDAFVRHHERCAPDAARAGSVELSHHRDRCRARHGAGDVGAQGA